MMLATFMLMIGTAAYGAGSSVIESLTVTFKTTYGEPGEIPDPEITISGSGALLGDVQFMTDYDKWKPGRKVRVEVNVNAEDGKLFPVSLNRSQCKVSGAEFVSAKALDDDTLQVKVDYKPVMVLETTEHAGWHTSSRTKAIWKSVEFAPGYNLTLYGDNKVVKRMNVESNFIDLAEYMTDEDKTYYYEVKAVPLTSEQKKYLKEGEIVTSTDREFDWEETKNPQHQTSGGPGDGGSLKGDSYVMPDGSKAYNTWKKLSDTWSYFDGAGNRARGWLNNGGKWYYMDQNGAMCTGWTEAGSGSWFYLGPDGDMFTGWIQPVPGVWYYLNQFGYMERDWVFIGDKWYYLEPNGRMKTGWLNNNGKWYYLYDNGSMAVNTMIGGWQIGADGVALR